MNDLIRKTRPNLKFSEVEAKSELCKICKRKGRSNPNFRICTYCNKKFEKTKGEVKKSYNPVIKFKISKSKTNLEKIKKEIKDMEYVVPKEKKKEAIKRPYIKKATQANLGALSELLVCADLLNEGFEIFRSVSATCSCDLIAMKNGDMYRVEVKSSKYVDKDKKLLVPKVNKTKYDLLAVVVGKKVFYFDDKDKPVKDFKLW